MTGSDSNSIFLDTAWTRAYGDIPPIAHEFKFKLQDRWLRIHTLPGSKRYPESDEEYAEILQRHNQAIDSQVSRKEKYYLISVNEDQSDNPAREYAALGYHANHWKSYLIDPDDEYFNHFYFDVLEWEPRKIDDLLQLVIDEQLPGVLLFFEQSEFLYHPYDGGADLIFGSTRRRDQAEHLFRDWLPDHPSGI